MTTLTKESVYLFFEKNVQKKDANDSNNKMREHIILSLATNQVPEEFFELDEWKQLKEALNSALANEGIDATDETFKMIQRGGRKFNHDFVITCGGKSYNIEFKFNASTISETPQFVSPMKPSQYMTASYEDFFYENHLQDVLLNEQTIPKENYLKSVHQPKPACLLSESEKYSNGYKKKDEESIAYYNKCCETTNASLVNFLKRPDVQLDVEKLNNYLESSQRDKIYLLFKEGKFYIEKHPKESYTITSYVKDESKHRFLATTESGEVIKILLRWKNGKGIAFPAFQIS